MSTEMQSLLPTTGPSWKQKIGYGILTVGGVVGAGLCVYNISQPSEHTSATPHPVRLVGDIFSALACLALAALAGKETIKQREVQIIPPATIPTAEKTDSISQTHLQQLQSCIQRFDAILALIFSKSEDFSISLSDNPITYEHTIDEINSRLAKLESRIQHPDQEYILSLLRKTKTSLSNQNSANPSTTTSPYKSLQTPSPAATGIRNEKDLSTLIEQLEKFTSAKPDFTPPDSPMKISTNSQKSPLVTPREDSDD